MKTFRASVGVVLVAASLGFAQTPTPADPAAPIVAASAAIRTAQELEQLVGPIALYPDALIALILPASTAPADVVLAARYVRDFPNDRSQVEHRAWDESVKSLTNYPDVLQWMDQNLQWTKQLGEAFAAQPADTMEAVQRLRARARAAGTLVDTPQQQVIADPQVIRIVPAQPDVIYVPRYEPEVVFVDRPLYYPQPFVTFGLGMPVGSWLAFDFDWHRHTIWMGNRHRHWTGHDWRRPVVPIASPTVVVRSTEVRQWRPPPAPPRPVLSVAYTQASPIARPVPFGTTRPYGPRPANTYADHRRPETNSLPAMNPLPRTFGRAMPSADLPGPRVAPPTPAANAPQGVTFRTQPPPAPSATVTPPPATMTAPANRGWSRDARVRQQPAPAYAAPLPSVPSLPMASAPQSTATVMPAPRAYSRQVQPAPALPMAVPVRSAPVGPVVAAPAPAQAAPAAAPAQPAPRTAPADDRRSRREQQER